MQRKRRAGLSGVLILLLVVGLIVLNRQQAIRDYLALRSYSPSAQVASLARADTMTPSATRLFYVNRPDITSGNTFRTNCPSDGEKTIVLGCYKSPDKGIYLYDVTDSRLEGVEQVTAAHEMLHAAYRRLHKDDRARVDAMLTDYYQHGLRDARIKATIDAYKQSEPTELVNEMHSIFGTEVANLPGPLEEYYTRYFERRAAVTGFAARYQMEFTSRQQQVTAFDSQLATLSRDIRSEETMLSERRQQIESQAQTLQTARSRGDIQTFNQRVDDYNAAVNDFNARRSALQAKIDQYNQIVTARNAVVVEERQLTKALTNTTEQL